VRTNAFSGSQISGSASVLSQSLAGIAQHALWLFFEQVMTRRGAGGRGSSASVPSAASSQVYSSFLSFVVIIIFLISIAGLFFIQIIRRSLCS
jgi:hypothetical protein